MGVCCFCLYFCGFGEVIYLPKTPAVHPPTLVVACCCVCSRGTAVSSALEILHAGVWSGLLLVGVVVVAGAAAGAAGAGGAGVVVVGAGDGSLDFWNAPVFFTTHLVLLSPGTPSHTLEPRPQESNISPCRVCVP